MTEKTTKIFKIQLPIGGDMSQALLYTEEGRKLKPPFDIPQPDYFMLPVSEVYKWFPRNLDKIYAECEVEPFKILRRVKAQRW